MENDSFEKIWNTLKKSKKVLMSLHPGPDGDSLGSCMALRQALKNNGKRVSLFSKDRLSVGLERLNFAKEIEFQKDISEIDWKEFDTVIFLDHGTIKNYSQDMTKKFNGKIVINIDHHDTNPFYGNLNYVNPLAPSACSVLLSFFRENGIKIDKEMANSLVLGMVTDAGFFTNESANKIFEDISFLTSLGADYFRDIFMPVMENIPFRIKKFYGVLQSNLEIIKIKGANLAFSFIGFKDVKRLGLEMADIRLGVTAIEGIENVDFQLILAEVDGEIKGSFRSSGIDVCLFAKGLGGGGHKSAAGFILKSISLEEAKKRVLGVIEKVGIHKA